jgi:uncharacterized RDD family membrane protein YckC
MRCPKCHYLSFEPEPRCRNCGFDLATHDPDPLIKDTEDEGPLVDLDLRRPPSADERSVSLGQMRPPREVEKPRPSGYRPPAPRQPEQGEPRPQGRSAAAVVDPPRHQPARPDIARPHGFRPEPRQSDVAARSMARPGFVRPEVTRPEIARQEAKTERPRTESPRIESRIEHPRAEPPQIDPPRLEAPRPKEPRPEEPRVEIPRPQRAPHTTSDLPLFLKRLPDPEPGAPAPEPTIERKPLVEREPLIEHEPLIERDPITAPVDAEIDRPLVKVPSIAREPLSVRRPVESPKPKSEPEIVVEKDNAAYRDLLAGIRLSNSEAFGPPVVSRPDSPHRVADLGTNPRYRTAEPGAAESAGPIGRTFAAVLDTVFLAAVGSAVLWITMRVCGLTMDDVPALPALTALPLFAFVLLICLGYLLLFTAAGGQTLGKMAARIRVVATSPDTGDDEPLNIQRAAFRSVVALPSVLALGAGFLPALVGERRAVHDRIALTRVVRA